jgi:O-methyltransferase
MGIDRKDSSERNFALTTGLNSASRTCVQQELERLREEISQIKHQTSTLEATLHQNSEEFRARLNALEQRFLTYYRERFNCIDKLADYLVGAQLDGDYYEFGVSRGVTFAYAMRIMQGLFPQMHFVALDSFEGLPIPKGLDAVQDYSGGFYAGEFACSREDFLKHVSSSGVDVDRVKVVAGWFDQSLASGDPRNAQLGKVAAAWIDCDLYESTIPVLEFLTKRLSIGSVLLFDDWRCFRNLPGYGEQRACSEWLDRNPQIKLREFVDFGFHGISFTVEQC